MFFLEDFCRGYLTHKLLQSVVVFFKQIFFQVQLLDLTSAMYYILKEEIPRRQLIEGENMSALKLWIHMLKKVGRVLFPTHESSKMISLLHFT